jgi:hypothetical protein
MRCELFLDGERDRFIECVCVAYDDAIVFRKWVGDSDA